MAIMDPIFFIFDTGIRFPNGQLVKGNNTYTYVASFPVTFPGINSQIIQYDPGIFTGLNPDGLFFNGFGADIYYALDTDGSELVPASGFYRIQLRTSNGRWGNRHHRRYGAAYPAGQARVYLNFWITSPNTWSGALTVTVRVYMKPSNAREEGIFENPDFSGESRPNGGNYPGSFYGV